MAMTARSSRFRPNRNATGEAALAAQHLAVADRFPNNDPRRSANQRAAARLVAADPTLLDSRSLAPWRDDLAMWIQFVPYLLDDGREEQLSASGRAVIRHALADVEALEASPSTALGAAEIGVHRLDSSLPEVRTGADDLIAGVTRRRAPVMCAALHSLTTAHATDDAARGIDNWRLRFAFSQQTDVGSIDHLLDSVWARADVAREWWAWRAGIVGARYADRRAGLPVIATDLTTDAELVASTLAAALPEARSAVQRGAAQIRPGSTNEVVFEADGRLSVTVDHRPTARGRLMVAHELGHAVHALRARDRRPPGALVGETMACWSALTVGVGLAQPSCVEHSAAAVALGDMVVDELFLSALVCRFEGEIQRIVRSGGALDVATLDAIWLALHRELFGDSVEVPPCVGSHWARLPSLAVHPGHAVSYVWATVLALAVHERTETATQVVAAMSIGAMPAAALPQRWGFADDSWVAAGLDALADLLATLRSQVAAGARA
jgi:hypothetical protein